MSGKRRPFGIGGYRKPNGRIDYTRLADVCAGWTDIEVRRSEMKRVLKAVFKAGSISGRKSATTSQRE
jgi:hypothetical protein